jgi:hypothetical protein
MKLVVDSRTWRFIDMEFLRFAKDARNLWLCFAIDGVNPHSLPSFRHSIWPLMMVVYNLPPWLLTKWFFICLSMIIPGPNSPTEETIDEYLQPMVYKLKKLWVEVLVVDMS